MKILVANNYYYLRGGAERVMFNDMRALERDGEEVIPFSVRDPLNEPSEHAGDFARGVDVHAKQPLMKIRAAREAIHCGESAEAFGRLIEKTQPDVLHCHNIYGRLTTAILPVARRLGIPTVLTTHDYKVVCPSYLMLRNGKPCDACLDGNYYRCAANRCHKGKLAESAVYSMEAYYSRMTDSYGAVSAFLCPSQFIADQLVKSGIDRSRVVYHPNSVDCRAVTPSYDGDYALYAGRLSHEKGVATLVEALKGTGIPLKVAGSGPLEESLRKLADGSGNIEFTGHCDGAKLAGLFRNAAFTVVPSEWYENAPMSVLESFAYGKAAVASRIGGIPELVTDGENGYLFPWGNGSELRAAVLKLWKDRGGQRRMGENARKLAATKFSQERRVASLLEIYGSLCARSGGAARRMEPANLSC